jgi:hypothetical protein
MAELAVTNDSDICYNTTYFQAQFIWLFLFFFFFFFVGDVAEVVNYP